MTSYDVIDEALAALETAGPDLRNGMTNHAPMAAEALCAMGRGEAVMPWLDGYRAELLPWPAARTRITTAAWREALGRPDRATDWRRFFRNELEGHPWTDVLDRWTARLAPAACAAATHGVIRVGHAVRALTLADTVTRRRELADALASWTSTHQTLPTGPGEATSRYRPSEAIHHVSPIPEAERRCTGTITGSLEALDAAPSFAPVIALANLEGEPAATITELTRTFALVYLANAHDVLGSIVFVHGVTSIAALRPILPHVRDMTRQRLLRYAWQASCGLYAAFGHRPVPASEPTPPDEPAEALIARALAGGDEHAIKFTGACLHEHALDPAPVYLAAPAHAVTTLTR